MEIANSQPSVNFISLIDLLCEDTDCLSSVSNEQKTETLVWDSAHFTELGAIEVAKRIISKDDE